MTKTIIGIKAGKKQDAKAFGAPTIEEARLLRQTTPVGSQVRFRTQDKNTGENKMVEATVIAVYPHIFMVHTGETYSWVEYMLGK
jgi:hypothetical protein